MLGELVLEAALEWPDACALGEGCPAMCPLLAGCPAIVVNEGCPVIVADEGCPLALNDGCAAVGMMSRAGSDGPGGEWLASGGPCMCPCITCADNFEDTGDW